MALLIAGIVITVSGVDDFLPPSTAA